VVCHQLNYYWGFSFFLQHIIYIISITKDCAPFYSSGVLGWAILGFFFKNLWKYFSRFLLFECGQNRKWTGKAGVKGFTCSSQMKVLEIGLLVLFFTSTINPSGSPRTQPPLHWAAATTKLEPTVRTPDVIEILCKKVNIFCLRKSWKGFFRYFSYAFLLQWRWKEKTKKCKLAENISFKIQFRKRNTNAICADRWNQSHKKDNRNKTIVYICKNDLVTNVLYFKRAQTALYLRE